MFYEAAAGETITVTARLPADGRILDQTTLGATPDNRAMLDDLYLRFDLAAEQNVEICGHAEAHCSTSLLRYLTLISSDDEALDPEAFSFQGVARPGISDLSCVIFGTTAVCNASCLHCPTNKDYRRDFPHGYMDFTPRSSNSPMRSACMSRRCLPQHTTA